jgi:hypothetical protein
VNLFGAIEFSRNRRPINLGEMAARYADPDCWRKAFEEEDEATVAWCIRVARLPTTLRGPAPRVQTRECEAANPVESTYYGRMSIFGRWAKIANLQFLSAIFFGNFAIYRLRLRNWAIRHPVMLKKNPCIVLSVPLPNGFQLGLAF